MNGLEMFFKSTDVPIPERLVDQVIGQGQVLLDQKAAEQRRHMMIGIRN